MSKLELMSFAHGLPPVSSSGARVLLLGTMPGKSLRLGRYYAHTRNSFWALMDDILDIESKLDYEARLQCLRDAGVRGWRFVDDAVTKPRCPWEWCAHGQ